MMLGLSRAMLFVWAIAIALSAGVLAQGLTAGLDTRRGLVTVILAVAALFLWQRPLLFGPAILVLAWFLATDRDRRRRTAGVLVAMLVTTGLSWMFMRETGSKY